MQSTCIRSYAECLQVHWSGYASRNRVWRAFANIRDAIGRAEFPSRVALPSSPTPSSKRSKVERRDRGTWDTILPRMYIFAELCNCATLVDWRLIVSRERERERNEDYDKWSAFIMQQSTITTGIMQMDRWKIKETRLLVSPFAFVMSKHAWSYDSNEYKSYCNGTRLRALSSPFYEGLTKKERRQAQNRLRLFEFKTEINRCEWVYCKRERERRKK